MQLLPAQVPDYTKANLNFSLGVHARQGILLAVALLLPHQQSVLGACSLSHSTFCWACSALGPLRRELGSI